MLLVGQGSGSHQGPCGSTGRKQFSAFSSYVPRSNFPEKKIKFTMMYKSELKLVKGDPGV